MISEPRKAALLLKGWSSDIAKASDRDLLGEWAAAYSNERKAELCLYEARLFMLWQETIRRTNSLSANRRHRPEPEPERATSRDGEGEGETT